MILLLILTWAQTADVSVHTVKELQAAVAKAGPGTRIIVAAGEYPGGFYFSNLRGTEGKPIIIAGADPQNPPVFKGKTEGMHLIDPAFVELRDLAFTGASGNGLNVDDGGSFDSPAHHIILRNLLVTDVGPTGNHDGIKLSGVDDFRVENCTVERWGSGGSAIDMVGCHHGVIEGSLFRHTGPASSGIQAKGGSRDVVIRRNRFENAGSRGINIGGSTDLPLFRPPLTAEGEHAEAQDIRVEGNTFIGSDAPFAFVGADGAIVRFNTIYRPGKWAMRILQETRAPQFVPCRRGEFTDNIVIFESTRWAEGGVNIGPHTAPDTFRFARNFWFCLDEPTRSRPKLPVAETEGVYGPDPLFSNAEQGDLRLQSNSPAARAGADALPRK